MTIKQLKQLEKAMAMLERTKDEHISLLRGERSQTRQTYFDLRSAVLERGDQAVLHELQDLRKEYGLSNNHYVLAVNRISVQVLLPSCSEVEDEVRQGWKAR